MTQTMAKRKNNAGTTEATGATVGYEAELWRMAELRQQQAEAARLDAAIARNLEELGFK